MSNDSGLVRRDSNQIQVQVEDEDEKIEVNKELSPEEKLRLKLEEKKKAELSSKRLSSYIKENLGIFIGGSIAAVIGGCLMPFFALLMADMIDILAKFDVYRAFPALGMGPGTQGWDDLRSDALMIGLYFLIMAVIALATNFLQLGLFNILAQRITTSLRIKLFSHFITRDMEFFDNPKNSPGELSSALSKDCLTVNTIVSSSYGAIFSAAGSFACGIVIAMIASWRLALVSLSVSPLIVLAGYIESQQMGGGEAGIDKADTYESKTFQETVTNMRTVSSLNAQADLIRRFDGYVDKEDTVSTGKKVFISLLYGIG